MAWSWILLPLLVVFRTERMERLGKKTNLQVCCVFHGHLRFISFAKPKEFSTIPFKKKREGGPEHF